MRWKYCEDCYINGHCENQDRGHECNVYAKRITDKCERLQKQLDIAIWALQSIKKGERTIFDKETGDLHYIESYALIKIEELNK